MGWLKSIFAAVGAVFGWMRERSALKNAPDVRQAEIQQKETDTTSKVEKDVAKEDVEAIRKDLAE